MISLESAAHHCSSRCDHNFPYMFSMLELNWMKSTKKTKQMDCNACWLPMSLHCPWAFKSSNLSLHTGLQIHFLLPSPLASSQAINSFQAYFVLLFQLIFTSFLTIQVWNISWKYSKIHISLKGHFYFWSKNVTNSRFSTIWLANAEATLIKQQNVSLLDNRNIEHAMWYFPPGGNPADTANSFWIWQSKDEYYKVTTSRFKTQV